MSTSVFDFKTQLRVGERGQELFLKHYHEPLQLSDTLAFDFIVRDTGEPLELKTDTYNMLKTPNFFWERWSDVINKRPGGPWQAHEKGAKRFVYMFVRHNTYFEFRNIPALLVRLDALTKDSYGIAVKNRGWITSGYAVKREAVHDLYTAHYFTPEAGEEYSIYGNSGTNSGSTGG